MRWLLPVVIAAALWPTPANAQAVYGQRLQGQGGWLLPVASRLLCSDSAMHVRRNSIPSWDICAPNGSAIYAAAPGRVIYAGCNNAGGYGCWVKLDHGGGITSAYAHMIIGSIMVQTGQQVDQSTVLGQIGWTGQTSFGPHVHFVIYKNGVHIDPAQVFSQQAMQFCDKCAAPGDTPVAASGIAGAMVQQQAQVVSLPSKGQQVVMTVGMALLQTGDALYPAMVVVIFIFLLVLWLSPVAVRIVIVCTIVCVAVTVTVAMMFIPQQTEVAMPQQIQVQAMPGDVWQYALELTVGSEGWKCTNDGAYTAGGITQGAYNAWRQSKGLPPADVCQSLTKQERAQIFYDRYWIPSGANQLPPAIALTYVDHAFNAGIGAAKQGLQACGTNATCYNNWREIQYRGMRTCFLYCKGWINRVNKFRKYEAIR